MGLNLTTADQFIEEYTRKAQKFLSNLDTILASVYVSKESILQASREILASIGEGHSVFILTNILLSRGVHVRLIDLSGFDDYRALTIDHKCWEDRIFIKNVISIEHGRGVSVVRKRNLLRFSIAALHYAEDFSSFLVRNDSGVISSQHL